MRALPADEMDRHRAEGEQMTEALKHDWIKSTLGHGETMCSRCCITNREAWALGWEKCIPMETRKPYEPKPISTRAKSAQ